MFGNEACVKREAKPDLWEQSYFAGTMDGLISVLIVEDDEMWAESLRESLFEFGFQVTAVCPDFETAVVSLNRSDYDIVLLDIHLDGKESGIELGKMIDQFYRKPFIFLTASMDGAMIKKAVDARPSAYLTKPVHPASIFATIHSAIRHFSEKNAVPASQVEKEADSFFVKQGDKYRKVYWNDIVCLRSEKNYTALINAKDGTTSFVRSTLPKTLRFLVPVSLQPDFIQINRSEAVQRKFIKELNKDEILTDHGPFEVTEAYTKQLREKLKIIQ